MSESRTTTILGATRDMEKWTLREWWFHLQPRHAMALFTAIAIIASAAAKIAYSLRTEQIDGLQRHEKLDKNQLADARRELAKGREEIDALRKRLDERENPTGDLVGRSGTVSVIPGPPRIGTLILTLMLGNSIRWTIIEPYGTGWTKRNGEERFQALEAVFDALKAEATRKGYLWQEYLITGLFDRPEDRQAITRLYAEFYQIDMALTAALRDRDPEQTCAQLARWRTTNAEYMRLASRRLVELVHGVFLQPSTGGPCLVDR